MTINEAKEKLERTSVLWEGSPKTDIVEAVKIAIKALEDQDKLKKERDYWEREAKKAVATLGEIRIVMSEAK